MGTHISVIMPAYDEAPNLAEVVPRTVAVLQGLGVSFELVVVDDGSTDGTRSLLAGLAERHPGVRALRLRRNCGKSTALQVGFDHTDGEIVVLMDADGQDDPAEIPVLLDALAGGADLVTGRRVVRHDRMVKRNTSRLYNRVTAGVTGVAGRDFNSGLKAMTRSVADALELYGELHRYVPVLAVWAGFAVSEVDVAHHARLHGSSKFDRSRFWRGFLDLLTVKFLTTYTTRPFHLFGGLGVASGLLGAALLVWMGASKLAGNAVGQRPALLLGVLLVVVGVQLMSLGLLAELVVHYRRPRGSEVLVETVSDRLGRAGR